MAYWFELVAGGLITGGIYAVVALGLNLQYGLMRIMNISHGEFLMLGAYLTWLAHTVFGINPVAFLPVVAILMLTSEWSQRSAFTTFTQEPRRIRVVNAKLAASMVLGGRSEERRVGKECAIVCRSRWSPYH